MTVTQAPEQHGIHPTIIVASRTRAGHLLLSTRTGPGIQCVISIGDPGSRPAAGFARRPYRLRLLMHDVSEPNPLYVAPRLSDAEAIIAFARLVVTQPGSVLVHCEAGISRSTAAALLVLATWQGPGHESAAACEIRRIAALAEPNALLVRYGDDLLGRSGALVQACNETFYQESTDRALVSDIRVRKNGN